MFVTVKYGDQCSKLVNYNCRNKVLLSHIKKTCLGAKNEVIDLSDENGIVKNLRQHPNDYGTAYFKKRESVILLKVQSIQGTGDQPEKILFIPMLNSLENDKTFIDTLNASPEKEKELVEKTPKLRRKSSSFEMTFEETKNGKTRLKSSNTPRRGLGRRSTTRNLMKVKN
ncbi:uncharacterized protein CXorf65 homolog isoform X2 [Gigantopelta aegis]|uniref:uncharacterized protein CXorf65 homolog isoform X2 n=1 Tax=Gigantopelta aegis TaxID=1735272 RepID=UPI001B88C018|nr:uncharacterized protein CXorf65 homolog isoform X2 [Gigantopelta aegis]